MLSAVPNPSPSAPGLASTEEIIEEIRRGHIVVLVDDEDRENEGDLIFAADFVTPEKINFLAKHGRGLICMPVTAEHAAQLERATDLPRVDCGLLVQDAGDACADDAEPHEADAYRAAITGHCQAAARRTDLAASYRPGPRDRRVAPRER